MTKAARAMMCLLALLPGLAGCQSQSTLTDTAAADAASPAESVLGSAPKDTFQGLTIRSDVSDLAGTWALIATSDQRDGCFWLMTFSKSEAGEWSCEIGELHNESIKVTAGSVTFDGTTLNIPLTLGEQQGRFTGLYEAGAIRGGITVPGAGIQPARLLPTSTTSLAGIERASPTEGTEIFKKIVAMPKKDEAEIAMYQFAIQFRHAPLALGVLQGLIPRLATKLKPEEIEQVQENYCLIAETWGPLLAVRARFDVLQALLPTERFALICDKVATKLDGIQTADRAEWEPDLKRLRNVIDIQIALDRVSGTDEAEKSAALAKLNEDVVSNPYNYRIVNSLAEDAEGRNETDRAIELLTQMVATPLMQMQYMKSLGGNLVEEKAPEVRLRKLWFAKHGEGPEHEASLKAHLHQKVREISGKPIRDAAAQLEAPKPPAAADAQTLLIELFTGALCPPCVAADLALDGLQQAYPTTRVVLVQYHQHIPGPDPLTCQAADDRFAYYQSFYAQAPREMQVDGTPKMLLNGIPVNGVGGNIGIVGDLYRGLRQAVDQLAEKTTPVRLECEAKVEEGELRVKAVAQGLTPEEIPNHRLYLAVVEDHIEAMMPNGILDHHNVVRDLLGGAGGIAAIDGQLKYDVSLKLTEFRQYLVDYLATFEAGRNMKFPEKPLTLKPLSLVVWVQNMQSSEIRQVLLTPFVGEITYPE